MPKLKCEARTKKKRSQESLVNLTGFGQAPDTAKRVG